MKLVIVVLIVLSVLLYGFFEARRLLEGPQISIQSPLNGTATSSTILTVAGKAENISFITINDKPSHTDEDGNFRELLSLHQGITVVTVSGADRFGRRVSRSVSINILNYCSTS